MLCFTSCRRFGICQTDNHLKQVLIVFKLILHYGWT